MYQKYTTLIFGKIFNTFVSMNDNVTNIRLKIIEGLQVSFDRLIAFKKKINSKIVISKDGKIFYLKPEDFNR